MDLFLYLYRIDKAEHSGFRVHDDEARWPWTRFFQLRKKAKRENNVSVGSYLTQY